jgi:hypothetical protein
MSHIISSSSLNKTKKRLLVTGCGRSGTKYIARILQRAGLDIGHETMGEHGISSWYMTVNAVSAPFGDGRAGYVFENTLHQIRHPLAVIDSLVASPLKKESWDFICRYMPISMDEPLLTRCAKYWLHWNCAAEKIADVSYRVENLGSDYNEQFHRLNIDLDSAIIDLLPSDSNTRRYGYFYHAYDELCGRLRIRPSDTLRRFLSKGQASRPASGLSWDDLRRIDATLERNVREKADVYGYR